jgi:hypothetical protein
MAEVHKMMNMKSHIHRVVTRSKAFYRTSDPGHFLIAVKVPSESRPIPPLSDFDLDEELGRWLNFKLEAARPQWRAKQGLDDDAIPTISPHFGIAEHSAWLGLDVHLQETTCLPAPLINTPDDISLLQCSESTKWFRYMKDGYEHLRNRQDGSFVLSVRGQMTPMDVADAVRGNEIYVDFLLEPDFCHRLLNRLVEAIPWYYEHLVSWATEIEGGHVFHHSGGWMPAKTIGHLSNDAAMLCSSDIYKEFGYLYESRLLEPYDYAFYHVHNEKMHYVPFLTNLPQLAMLEVSHDPKTIRPIEDLERIFAATGSANLMLAGDSDQVRKHIEALACRNVFLQVSCTSREDAEDIIAFVRDRSQPL